jgi:DNA-binding beta-propeller fold protein YncE
MTVFQRTLFAAIAALIVAAAAAVAAPAPKYTIVAKIPLPGSVRWSELYADSATHRLFVARGSFVSVIDANTDKEVGRIPGKRVHSIAALDDLGLGFVTDSGANAVIVFDLKSLKVKTLIPVDTYPDGIVADSSTDKVACMNARASDLSIIDAKTLTITSTVKLNGRPEDYETDDAGHVFTHYKDSTEVAEVDEASGKIVKEWPLAPAADPDGMAMDRKRGLIFSACDNGMLAISSVITGKVVATVSIDDGPDQLAIDRDSGTVFVPCGSDGVIDVVAPNARDRYTLVDRADTRVGARTIAFDAATNTLYTCTAALQMGASVDDDDAGANRRPRWDDNSFFVMVLKAK